MERKCWGEPRLTPCSLQNAENLPAHFTRGNLSVLKKRWENPVPRAESGKETIRSSSAEVRHKVGTGRAPSPPPGEQQQQQSPAGDSTEPQSRSREGGTMENCVREPREMEKPEAGERSESPGRIEKYNVPLSKLKMMFEKGEAAQPKVRICPSQISGKLKLLPRPASGKSREGVAPAIDSANIVFIV